jgi:hypothetical protein
MNSQQDETIALLESYVLAESKEAFIKTLVPDSENQKFVLTLHELVTKGDKLSEETKEILRKWSVSPPGSSNRNYPVLIRHLLMSIEKESGNPEKVKELIRQIDKLSENCYNRLAKYSKPVMFAAGDEFQEDSENRMSSELNSTVDPNLLLSDLVKKVTDAPNFLNSLTETSILVHVDLDKASVHYPDAINAIFGRIPTFANLKVVLLKQAC